MAAGQNRVFMALTAGNGARFWCDIDGLLHPYGGPVPPSVIREVAPDMQAATQRIGFMLPAVSTAVECSMPVTLRHAGELLARLLEPLPADNPLKTLCVPHLWTLVALSLTVYKDPDSVYLELRVSTIKQALLTFMAALTVATAFHTFQGSCAVTPARVRELVFGCVTLHMLLPTHTMHETALRLLQAYQHNLPPSPAVLELDAFVDPLPEWHAGRISMLSQIQPLPMSLRETTDVLTEHVLRTTCDRMELADPPAKRPRIEDT